MQGEIEACKEHFLRSNEKNKNKKRKQKKFTDRKGYELFVKVMRTGPDSKSTRKERSFKWCRRKGKRKSSKRVGNLRELPLFGWEKEKGFRPKSTPRMV